MTRKIVFLEIIFLLALLVLVGCKKHKEKFLGSETVLASKDFYVAGNKFEIWRAVKGTSLTYLIPSATTPYAPFNFERSSQYYNARLSERVSWKVEITCYRTGAQKIVTGVSDSINYSNSLWDGGATTDKFFYTNDTIEVKLSFAGSNLILRDTLVVNAAKSYITSPINPVGNDGIIYHKIDDFEGDPTTAKTAFSPFYIDQGDMVETTTETMGLVEIKYKGTLVIKCTVTI
jgi:hypothetical protein